MTQDEIIEMARQAGLWPAVTDIFLKELIAFAKLVAEHERERVQKVYEDAAKDSVKAAIKQEREACATLCDVQALTMAESAKVCAEAIRARGQT
jgi:hypothetical protein